MEVKSYAKINLRLEILGKRADGFHEIKLISLPIDLYDTLNVNITSAKREINFKCENEESINNNKNLVYRVAKYFFEKYKVETGVDIVLYKNIPLAAGLGGGSSNAASTLIALNSLLNLKLSLEELINFSVSFGSDIPFFLVGKAAIVSGVGEIITPLEEPIDNLPILLIKPNFGISSKWAYETFDFQKMALTKKNKGVSYPQPKYIIKLSNIGHLLKNDLEVGCFNKYPILGNLKKEIVNLGAIGALMSGSGSTIFGIFETDDLAKKTFDFYKSKKDLFVWRGKTLKSTGASPNW